MITGFDLVTSTSTSSLVADFDDSWFVAVEGRPGRGAIGGE